MKEIRNCINQLRWSPTYIWSKRSLNKVNQVIVHQALSEGSVEAINKYHISPGNHISNKGCPHICYHYVIDREDNILQTNLLSSIVWHCSQRNTHSIGILVLGNFDGPSYKGTQNVLGIQVENLRYLLSMLLSKYHLNRQNVFGHNDFGKENCPGNVITNFIRGYKE